MSKKRITGDFVNLDAGEYEAAFFDFETRMLFGRQPKLYIWFKLLCPGAVGILLPRYYNVLSISGHPRRGGKFKAGMKGNFVREYARLFSRIPDLNGNWSRPFKNTTCRVRLETCRKSFEQEDLPGPVQYSYVAKIVAVYFDRPDAN